MNKSEQLTLIENENAVVPADGNSIMAVISRAASDPKTDVDKLERLMAMYERIEARKAEQAFNEAMNGAQTEIRPIAADASNPQTKSKYASYPALDRALRPIYTNHGFALSFDTGESPADMVRVLCYVAHKAGHSRTYHADIAADGKGAKGGDVMPKIHAIGSAMSYGQRYLLKLIFNIAVGDDDGNAAGDTTEKIGEEDVAKLLKLIDDSHSDIEKWCKYMKIEAVTELRKKDLGRAYESLHGALERLGKKK